MRLTKKTLTINEILTLNKKLNELLREEKIDAVFAWDLDTNVQKTSEIGKRFNDKLSQLGKEHALKDENGKPVMKNRNQYEITPENQELVNSEIENLLQKEETIELIVFGVNEFRKYIPKVQSINLLRPMLEKESEEETSQPNPGPKVIEMPTQ